MHALEYNKKASFRPKSYFLARKLLQGDNPATLQEWGGAIVKLNPGQGHPRRDSLMHFLTTSGGSTWKDFEALREGFIYFFDIAPSSGRPEVKFYLTTRKYGADDLTIARNLMAWMHTHGRGTYYDAYLGMLEKLAEHRGLANGKGMHAYISYQCSQKGEPDIKSYISPELYHKDRYASI